MKPTRTTKSAPGLPSTRDVHEVWDRLVGRGPAESLEPKPEGWLTAPDVLRSGLAGASLNRILNGWRKAISHIEAGQEPHMGGRRVLFQVFRVYRQGRWCLHADDVPALCDEIGVGVLTPAAVVQLVPHYARPTAMLLMKRLAELTLAGRDVAVRGQTLGIALRELQGIKTVCLRRESVPAFLKAVITQFDRRTELQAVQHRL